MIVSGMLVRSIPMSMMTMSMVLMANTAHENMNVGR
jgi:hypothetical protein